MHGTSAGAPVTLSGYGGLVTLAKPESVPEGASPRTYDTDYDVGSVRTRAGLKPVYSFSGGQVGPNSASAVVDIDTVSSPWLNPSNILFNDGSFTTAILGSTVTEIVTEVTITNGGEYSNLGGAWYPTVVFSGTGSGATATVNMVHLGGVQETVGSVTITTPGSYTGTVTVSFVGGYVTVGGLGVATGTVVTSPFTFVQNQSDALQITGFGYSIPSTSAVTGIGVNVKGYTSDPDAVLFAVLMQAGIPVGNVEEQQLPTGSAFITFGGATDNWGAVWNNALVNNTQFGVMLWAVGLEPVYLDYCDINIYVASSASNFQFITTMTAQDGTVRNLSMDANGNLYVENVTSAPGVLSLALEGITRGSYAVGVNGPDVEYLAFTNLKTGSDMPLQYTPNWIDRITQVGPAAAPVFTPVASTTNTYAIATITQPAAGVPEGSEMGVYFLQSAGPGSTTAGNVVTVYYADSTAYTQDSDLVTAFNSGNATYVWLTFSGFPASLGPYCQMVTSVGEASPPGQPRKFFYFTYQVPSLAYTFYAGSGHTGYRMTLQRTLATMTTSVAVPGLEVGAKVTITGNSVSGYNTSWPISQNLNSGQMVITETGVASGVATFNYSLTGGGTLADAPAVGQLVTITGTNNANGALNVANATIVTATGGTTGSFTLSVSLADFGTVAEDGLATTAGTQFCFDPGVAVVGTSTNPIYGTGTGGTLTFVGATAQLISPGTKQGTVFFITRNGYYTAPAPPVQFTIPENCTSVSASLIPIGPPNVIARGIALTESGQNGVPGANFFTIPTPVQYVVNDVPYTATSLIINDNTTSSATFTFTDTVLLNAEAIDVYGYNLFNQIEIGDPGWISSYDSRNWYALCLNKVQNFNNLSFDGGHLSGQATPLGWTASDTYGALVNSPKFGSAYYIKNTSTGALTVAGLLSQTAFQDAYQQPIILGNTTYSVRVTCSNPSGITEGNLVVQLTAGGVSYGTFTLPLSQMTTDLAIYSGTLLTNELTTVPSLLTLTVSATSLGVNADILIDRIEPFPTAIPILMTTVFGSYAGLPEQVDAITGAVKFESENQQPVNGSMVLYDTLYGLKGWGGTNPGSSLYSLQKSSNLEPAQWDEPEVAQRSGGAIGPLAFDLGEQWFLSAARAGLYLFVGGQPGKISQEIYQVWDSINWTYGNTIWVKVDIVHRRIYVGIPLPTPNFWLPNAPVNANPTSPNVILVCNYQGIDSGEQLKSEPQMHTTMFGTLNAIDMRRKWTLWNIPSPYANSVAGTTDEEFYICNGRGNSKVYQLDETLSTDDGFPIDSLYTTAGLVELSKRQQSPGVGSARMRWGYLVAALESEGTIGVTLYPNRLLGPGEVPDGYNAWTLPGGFAPGKPALNDVEAPLNFAATRTFVEFRENDGSGFSLSNLMMHAKADVWNKLRGAK